MATGDLTMRSNFEQLPAVDGNESSSTTINPETEPSPPAQNGGEWEGPPRRNTIDLNYMHRPPTILPNYGKRKGVLKLKTNVPRVLLFDNVTQQTMLDVELTCLQSQRHKADRELSMQARSFMLRRQFKQRFLKNLTKVFHDDDYWEFEQEYLALSNAEGQGQRKEAWPGSPSGCKHEGHFLPKLDRGKDGCSTVRAKTYENPLQHNQTANGGAAVDKPGRGRKRRNQEVAHARWSAADANRNAPKRHDTQNGFTKDKQRDLSLPHIRISPPQQGAQHSAPSELLQFSPPRKVGFRFQKTPAGITRIFHAHDNSAEDETEHQVDANAANRASPTVDDKRLTDDPDSKDKTESESKISADNTVEKTTGSDKIDKSDKSGSGNDSNNSGKPDSSQNTLQKTRPFKNFRRITNPFAEQAKSSDEELSPSAEPVEEETDKEFPTTTDKPTMDRRFKVLNKLLVKQVPPNDGYIELSPSFARNGPLHKLHNRIRELQLDAGLAAPAGARDGSARSYRGNYSQAPTPELSEHDHSQSEVDEARPDLNTNDALRRLGGM